MKVDAPDIKDRMKRAVLTRMARSGIGIMRTEPRIRPQRTHFDADLRTRVAAEVEGFGLNDRDWTTWTSPAAVMGYLEETRVNSYHQTVATVAGAVDLNGKRVLDVGTCSGYLLRIIEDRFDDVTLTGTDYYEECVRLSQAMVPGGRMLQASIDDLRNHGERFDVVFCTEVLEHIVDTETQIPGLLSLVEPGGSLMVTVPNGQYDSTPAFTSDDGVSFVGHVNFWTPQSWAFYITRICAALPYPVTHEIGQLGNNFEGDVLYALIGKA